MSVYKLPSGAPEADPNAWPYIAPGAQIAGRVKFGAQSSVWFNAVIRGDNEAIEIGEGTNIQDGAILHTDPGFPLHIGAGCTVGHGAILHGCIIEAGCLIGMGAIIMNGAHIRANSIVGAGALVPEFKEFPEGSLIIGMPAKIMRPLSAAEREKAGKAHLRYIDHATRYKTNLEFLPPRGQEWP